MAQRLCIAVGFSTLTSGVPVPLAERWNGSSWSIQETIAPSGAGGQLNALSCPTSRFCIAVGSHPPGALIERWNGSRWSLQRPAGVGAGSAAQLDGVSCPSRGRCVAVGLVRGGALAELWKGGRWERFPAPRGVGLTAVSCTSPHTCSAISNVNRTYAVQRWNGRRWTQEGVPGIPRPVCDPADETCANILSAITCVAASTCYVTGAVESALEGGDAQDTATPTAASWHGARWQREPVRNPGVCPNKVSAVCGTTLNAISCTARSVCVAVGAYSNATSIAQPLIEDRSPGAWSVQLAPSPFGPASSELNGVSCPSATACTAVGSYTDASGASVLLAERWGGAAWTMQPTPGSGEFVGVSCTSATSCIAVGQQNLPTSPPVNGGAALAETWNGTTWTPMQTAGAGTLDAVSCTSPAACMAVGATGLAESWDGVSWTVQPSAIVGLSAVSCVSSQSCMATGQDDADATVAAEGWNGTSWTSLPLPKSHLNAINPLFTGVSCSAQNACTLVANDVLITGSLQTGVSSSEQAIAFRWDGATWSAQAIQLPRGEDVSTIGGVACPAANSCTLVGSYAFFPPNEPEQTAPLLAHSNGATWSVQPPPSETAGLMLNGVSCPSATTCTAVGTRAFIMPDGNPGSGFADFAPYILSYH